MLLKRLACNRPMLDTRLAPLQDGDVGVAVLSMAMREVFPK